MTRRSWTRTFLLALIAGAVIWLVSMRSLLAIVFFVATLVVWLMFELIPGVRGATLRSPVVLPIEREEDDYGRQLSALMMMPLNEAPLARSRVALMFAGYQLSAAERSVLVRWATFALSGGELDYDIQAVPGWAGNRWRVECHVDQAAQALAGAIEGSEAHRIVEAHKTMVSRLLEERRAR